MPNNSTPLATFLPAVRAVIDVKDRENPTSFDITEKLKATLNLGKVPGYKMSADNSSVEPALTPQTDQNCYALLVKNAAVMFRHCLTEDQIFDLQAEIYHLGIE